VGSHWDYNVSRLSRRDKTHKCPHMKWACS